MIYMMNFFLLCKHFIIDSSTNEIMIYFIENISISDEKDVGNTSKIIFFPHLKQTHKYQKNNCHHFQLDRVVLFTIIVFRNQQ